jgi:methyl-accepting chemotaxis protein
MKAFLSRFSIAVKINIMVLILVAIGSGSTGFLVYQLEKSSHAYDQLVRVRLTAAILSERIRGNLQEAGRVINLFLLEKSPERLTAHEELFRDVLERIKLRIQDVNALLPPAEAEPVRIASDALEDMRKAFPGTVERRRADMNGDAAASYWGANGRAKLLPAAQAMFEFSNKFKADSTAIATQMAADNERTTTVTTIGAGLALLMGMIGVMLFTRQMISKPLQALTRRIARVVEDGAPGAGTGGDEVTRIQDTLLVTFDRMGRDAAQVAAAADQSGRAIEQVVRDVHTQFGALQEVSGAMADVARQITAVSDNAAAAGVKAKASVVLAGQGEVRLDDLLVKINSIGSNSKRDRQIADAIGKIANKTHILSLTAAIEAARAGEHGKGFVVVAQEVGKLAESAGQQTDSIAQIVEQAVDDTTAGVDAATKVRSATGQITAEIVATDTMVRTIAEAMVHQQSAATEIVATIGQLEQIASSNAAAAKEIAQSMAALLGLAKGTSTLVGRFSNP